MRTLLRITTLAAIVLGLLATASFAHAENQPGEDRLVYLANQARASAGLPPLGVDGPAVSLAHNWSSTMRAQSTIFHNPNLASDYQGEAWLALGENVGVGGSVDELHNAFMNSPPHRANILGDFHRVGHGIMMDGPTIFVTAIFWKGVNPYVAPAPAPAPPPPPPVAAPCAGRSPDSGGFMAFATSHNTGSFVASGNVVGAAPAEIVVGGPRVRVLTAAGSQQSEFAPYGAAFPGEVRVATADVNGDGVEEIVTSPGPGGGPHVRVTNAAGAKVAEWMAYSPAFHGGVYVAGGDVNGDGREEVITAPGAGGGPHVRVFSISGATVTEIAGFMAYAPHFRGGVRLASGQLNSSAGREIVTAPGPGGGPHVRVFSVAGGAAADQGGFMAYDPAFTAGLFVAGGDYSPGGLEEVATSPDAGGGPHVRSFFAQTFREHMGFMAYDCRFSGGVRVALGDPITALGGNEMITVPGTGGGPHVRIWD